MRAPVRPEKQQDYALAADWYKLDLDSFPDQPDAAKINFLLAESLYEAGDYVEAIRAYEKTAYQYPLHEYSGEAGFAVFYAYERLYQQSTAENKSPGESTTAGKRVTV